MPSLALIHWRYCVERLAGPVARLRLYVSRAGRTWHGLQPGRDLRVLFKGSRGNREADDLRQLTFSKSAFIN